MSITRRGFFRYCALSAATLGLDAVRLRWLSEALAHPQAPAVIWLIGSACTGCSISLLNRISAKAGEPATVAELLTENINLVFHPTIMGAAGETAAATLQHQYRQGNYILVLEGALPTAFGGAPCVVYNYDGVEVTFLRAVQELSARAAHVVCVGTCAAFGGIPASGSNPTQSMGIRQYTGRPTLNISGCPANPDWLVWALVQLLLNQYPEVDEDGRPVALYRTGHAGETEPDYIHDKCPRNPGNTGVEPAARFGENGRCLLQLGCRGPFTKARCQAAWNGIGGRVEGEAHPGHWCIGVNAPCHGCTEKTFPGTQSFFRGYTS